MTIKYQYFKDTVPQEIIDRIDKVPILGLDIETNLHLNPHDKDGRIRLVQISLSKNEIYIFDLFTLDNYEFLKTIFKGKLVLGQSLKFETKWLWKYNIDLSDCKWLFDTEIAARVIFNDQRESDWDDEDDEDTINLKKLSYSLKALCERHLNIKLEKELQTSDWGTELLTDDQLEYAAYDVYYLWDLREIFLPLIKEYNLVEICKIEFKHIFVSASLEYNGIYLDKEEWESHIPEYEQKIVDINNTLYKTLPGIYKQTTFYGEEQVSINLKSSKQLLSKLQEYGVPTNSTSDKELSLFDRNEYPILGIIKEKRTLEKHLSTYLQSFGKYIHPETNRIHYDIFQLAAKTGRISATNPPMLTIPRNDTWRKCFKGQNENYYLDIDYSQIESRLVAVIAQEKKMLEIFNNDLDIYAATAAIENDIPINEFLTYKEIKPAYYKNLRQGAKSEVLGLCLQSGTKIKVYDGWKIIEKNIEDIKVGDVVLTHRRRYCKVIELQQKTTTELVKITTLYSEGELSVTGTPDHLMLMRETKKQPEQWKSLANLNVGDVLIGYPSYWNQIIEKEYIKCPETIVYDFTVQDDHSFIANGLVSHNCFGMGEKRYQDYIDYVFKIKKPLSEIRVQRNRFLNQTYPRLKTWHEECTKDYDKIDYLVNINNRRLWLFKPEYNVCINYRIQSLATDIIKDALNTIFFYLKFVTGNVPLFDRNEIFQVAYVHDQGTWEGKKETLEKYKEVIEDIMKFVGEKHINYKVKIGADGHIASNWAESH